MKKIPLLAITILFCFEISAQKWTEMMNDTNANFYDIVKEFDAYWKGREIEKGKGYKAFKRWQWFMEPRVYPTGNMRYASHSYAVEQVNRFNAERNNVRQSNTSNSNSQSAPLPANWTPLGPFGSPVGGDAGRVQTLLMHPTAANTFFVGTACGGLWVTNNGGISYTTTTDQIGSCGVSGIAINPLNPSVIYISTGDKDGNGGGDTPSIGVLKSTDGGLTWNATGLAWQASQQRKIYRLLINPLNPNTLFAATSVGMYRSLNAGVSWTQVSTNGCVDAEYKPGDTTTVYAVTSGSFMRSQNGGASFQNVSFGVSGFTSVRLSLAVTSANNNYVYILCGATSNGFGGLYRSTDGGSTFSLMSSSPNIFDWSTNGSGAGGQAWYDIAIDASPSNADEIIAGGVNTWKSTDGGATWSLHTHWTGGGGRPNVHADLHCVLYVTGSTVYLGTDGGVHRTTNNGLVYSTINGNMNIAQIYKMGLSNNVSNRIITGHQDNGSNLMNGTTWTEVIGGDGMDCFIDWNNNNTMVSSYVNGAFRRSTNGGSSWVGITNGLPAANSANAAWVAPIVQDPITPNTYYCGYQHVYKSINQGSSWTQLGSIGVTLDEVKVAPSNPSVIYATSLGSVWKTTNGGSTWSNITGTVLTGSGQITDLAVHNTNPNIIFLTLSGYSAGYKVYASYDGGATWNNYSTGLPNIPINCIVYKKNSPHALYIGTDVGVYYREGSMAAWIPYMNGLPNIVVFDLEIYYPTGKLRAATYARGVWETDVYSDPTGAPTSAFYTSFSPGCINTPLQFNDLSANTPTAWAWSFQGASPASSNAQNPVVTYNSGGVYTVNLISTNSNGSSASFVTTVSIVSSASFAPVSASVCIGQTATFSLNTNASNVNWSNGLQGISVSVSSPSNALYTFTASLGACSSVGTASLYVDPPPPIPAIQVMAGYLTSTVTGVTYQWYMSGSIIPGATSATYAPTQDGYYSLWVSIGNCTSSSPYVQYVTDLTGIKKIGAETQKISIRPNPVKDELFLKFSNEVFGKIEYQILNSIGQIVLFSECNKVVPEMKINTAGLAPGIYYLTFIESGTKTVERFIKQ